ncbi:MAG: acyl-CoA thioesterase [Betaproteobacteria bacterium]|nr:MAG: acyl-CoA thioesterase [Betaproteobacteria bacterium]
MHRLSMESSKQVVTQRGTTPAPYYANSGPVMHEVLMPVRWGDMDAFAHVNNTVYFRFMEQCRIEWFLKIGAHIEQSDIVPMLVGADCRFIRAIKHPAVARVTIAVGDVGPKVVQTLHEIWVDDTLCAVGDCKIVWISQAANKAIALPEDIRARLVAR